MVVVSDPDLIATILGDKHSRFPMARIQDRILGSTYGENMVQGEQTDWFAERRTLVRH